MWQAAAERPVAAVGGTTGRTHVGGAAELAAARLHRAPPAAAAEEPAQPAEKAAAEAAAAEEDLRHGPELAAADVAAGHKAAADVAAATAGEQEEEEEEEEAGGPEPAPKAPAEGGATAEAKAAAAAPPEAAAEGGGPARGAAGREEEPTEALQPLPPIVPGVGAQYEKARTLQAQALHAAAQQGGGEGEWGAGYIMGPAREERQPPGPGAGGEAGPVERPPLLPAGAFGREQDISVFRWAAALGCSRGALAAPAATA